MYQLYLSSLLLLLQRIHKCHKKHPQYVPNEATHMLHICVKHAGESGIQNTQIIGTLINT